MSFLSFTKPIIFPRLLPFSTSIARARHRRWQRGCAGETTHDLANTEPRPNHHRDLHAEWLNPHQICTAARRPSRPPAAAATELTTLSSSDPPKYCDVAAKAGTVNYRREHRDVPPTSGGTTGTGDILRCSIGGDEVVSDMR